MRGVPPAKVTWKEKVRALLDARNLSVRKLASRVGRHERTVRTWISGTTAPLHETAVVAQMATALGVPISWLLDGQDSAPPHAPVAPDLEALAEAVPPRFRRLAFALADPETAEWMLVQLDQYERARRRAR